MKIVDAFIFYNELDLLKYRLTILDKFVDYFVLVEATHTHSGKEKPLFFEDNKSMFEAFLPKIIHIVVNDFPYVYPAIDYSKAQQWENENHQRNCISRGIAKLSLENQDVILISDLDEIPAPGILSQVRDNTLRITNIHSLQSDMYFYNLTTRHVALWDKGKILTYSNYKSIPSPQSIRHINAPIIRKAGWHLSYFGNVSFIKNKLNSFGHQELNIESINSVENIENSLKNRFTVFNKKAELYYVDIDTNTNLPPMYKELLESYI